MKVVFYVGTAGTPILQPQRRNVELAAVIAITSAAVGSFLFIESPLVRLPLAALSLLAMPGYALMRALFPELRWNAENRILLSSLSIAASISILAGTALLWNQTAAGIQPTSVLTTLTSMSLVMAAIARARDPSTDRLQIQWRRYLSSAPLSVLAIVAIGTTAYTLSIERPREEFTEFYLLGPNGEAASYPTTARQGAEISLTLVARNHNKQSTNYTISWYVDAHGSAGATAKDSPIERWNVTLESGDTWQTPIRYTIADAQAKTLWFAIYDEDGEISNLRVVLNSAEGGVANG